MAKIYPDIKRLFDNLGQGRKSKYSPDDIKREFILYIQDLSANDIEIKTTYQAQNLRAANDEEGEELQATSQRAQVRTQRFSRPPTIEDFVCRWLGMGRTWWYRLPERKNGKAYEEIQERITQYCYKVKYDGAAIGLYNSNIIARDLGLKEQIETLQADPYDNMTEEELEAEIKKLTKSLNL